ncbi:hypothetical protein Gbth_017_113 [Gluconobacter thailandicus F149-1 = NBRC 100600]|uniref:hypothetical protein n=1 Tax=Gluconobacter thailandicus TaxID=257438 RepID=UPI0005558489|nr:hypothetical protein [Gluconobacter thailandicus]KXV54494.1 hypothetical protein AD946_02845 [Gluconobacter thailandicus]GAN92938.1 hypothetical protein Gbth_017_113 [Gluconobacter thailandicus F149-1 = NBRC 100600]GBR61548.1 hypothetical protein AA100600_2887 [Gluconobacter thailandicus F149-1 = NBRC 100600]GEL87513.1 hypothetical protein GTH01_18710 [Gluconobacter thailandicus F149-1 = NBRC 100600]
MKILFVLLATVAGVGSPLQQPILHYGLGLTVYGVALTVLRCALPFTGVGQSSELLRSISHTLHGRHETVGPFVLTGSLAARKIGSAGLTVKVASCAAALSVILDHFGQRPHAPSAQP